jgi:ribulose-phosphate 3-epimerase
MSVNPGFGGQSFIPSTLQKITQVRARLDRHEADTGRKIRLEVDGGIKIRNIAQVAHAGADTFVAGSAIFGKDNYEQVIKEMRAELAKSGRA